MNKEKFSKDILVKNLRSMKIPAQLLKFGATGKPKFRTFQLSNDNQYLVWDSKNKSAEQTRIKLSDIKEVRYGQRTEKFDRSNRKDLTNFSFSIIYAVSGNGKLAKSLSSSSFNNFDGESLDLVCKDEKEFEVWAGTLLAVAQGKVDADVWTQLSEPSSPNANSSAIVTSGHVPHHHGSSMSVSAIQTGLVTSNSNPSFAVSSKNLERGLPTSPSVMSEMQDTNDLYTFGWGEWGQTATSSDVSNMQHNPQLIKSLLGKGVMQVACGWSHTTLLMEGGTLMQCGNRLGTGLPQDFFSPTATIIPDKQVIVNIACGSFHTLAITESGTVLSWGCSFHGQLGHGDNKDVKAPTEIAALSNSYTIKVACGEQTSAAITQDGSVYTWGNGAHGNLGHNDTRDRHTPTVIQFLQGMDVIKIAAGGGHMFACTDKETWAWGWNACGQLGLGHEQDQYRPHVVDTLHGYRVKDISCGAAHTLALA